MAYSYSGLSSGLTVFTYLVTLSVVTVAIPYFFAACAQLAYLVSGRRKVHGWTFLRDLSIAGLSVLFALWITAASGYQAVYQATILVLVGVPIYAFLKARKEREGTAPEPVDVTDATTDPELEAVSV
jgi:basic amino acid/polyamine antiporter, APA family